MTGVPDTHDFQEAKDAVFHAVENAEKSLMNMAKKAEKAAEHAIEDEVDTLFSQRKKASAEEAATESSDEAKMNDPDEVLHAVEKMYD